MADSDSHWILETEPKDWRSLRGWREFLGEKADEGQQAFIDALPPEVLWFVGWHVRRAGLPTYGAKDYKRFLGSVGGAGDSDWYQAKADAETESPPRPIPATGPKDSGPRKFKVETGDVVKDILTPAEQKAESAEFLASLQAIARGDLGDYQEDYDRFLKSRREEWESLQANPEKKRRRDAR